jgi:hypothetical protein
MKKVLLVATVVMLAGVIASAQLVSPTTYDRTFYGYCNGEHMVLQKLASSGTGSTKVYVGGYEDLTSACALPYNGPTVGQKHGIGPTEYPRAFSGKNGTFLDIGSAATDAICVCFSGFQEEWILDVKNNVGAGYFSLLGSDADYVFTLVYLSNGLPSKHGNAVGKPVLGSGKLNKTAKMK